MNNCGNRQIPKFQVSLNFSKVVEIGSNFIYKCIKLFLMISGNFKLYKAILEIPLIRFWIVTNITIIEVAKKHSNNVPSQFDK